MKKVLVMVAYHAGLSTKLYDTGEKWLSRLPGGLACATIAACAGFGAICGSCAATCATMGTISLPEMRKYGYDDGLSTSSIVMGGTLGVLIPPSTPFILYGIMTEQNIASLFISGIIPGVVMAVLCIITIVIRCKINKNLAPAPKSYTWKERFKSLKGLIGVVVLFGIVLGGMFSGFFSVNQSAAIGALCSILLCAVNRKLNWRVFKQARDLFNKIYDKYEMLSDLAGLNFDILSSAYDLPDVYADLDDLIKVISTLLDNTIKYVPEGGSVTISGKAAGRRAIICIEDTGKGIPTEALPYIFERFYRVSRDDAKQGSGLGLAIAKELTEAMKGTIRAESTPGKGTKMFIRLRTC